MDERITHGAKATSLHELAGLWRDMVPHCATLTRLAAQSRSILELGVRGGVSTWALLDGLPAGGRMLSVDSLVLPLPERITSDHRWEMRVADDRTLRLRRRFDLVFIDTSHEYRHTRDELQLAEQVGALVAVLHDFYSPGVMHAVAGALRRNWHMVEVEDSAWGLAVICR